ncbi:hypothetical protein LSTR_LSTR004791 [Laodelphax striatellus]|uniref:Vacuolar ATPase assembly integral membrane protein VMA21 homolog n=1 Tax=Laodelphax striatellus TaxID=195883 RepID=A0A482XLB2_LAOST|nr:hypothetical protein LSTR_LSTR004791 [Laodelphax striatellus]
MAEQSTESQDFEVFRSIFYYCFFILIVPLLTFFCAKFVIFEPIFGSTVNGSVYSAIVAIVTVHIALGLYIYKAYSEPTKQVKKD